MTDPKIHKLTPLPTHALMSPFRTDHRSWQPPQLLFLAQPEINGKQTFTPPEISVALGPI